MVSETKAMQVKQRYSAQLLSQPGITGVGIEKGDDGEFVLAIHVDGSNPDIASQLPKQLDGLPVKIVKSGPYRAFPLK